jgi:hypothetical protein
MMFDGLPLEARELNFRESIQVGTQYIALQDEAGECALTKDFDQASRLQLFNVMRESRGAHEVDFLQLFARRRFPVRPDLLENLHASRFGQHSADSRKLAGCQSSIVGY